MSLKKQNPLTKFNNIIVVVIGICCEGTQTYIPKKLRNNILTTFQTRFDASAFAKIKNLSMESLNLG